MTDSRKILSKNKENDMQKEQIKFADSDIFEGMPSISAAIKAIRSGDSDRRIEKIYIDTQKRASKSKEISFLAAVSSELGYAVEYVSEQYLSEITVGNTHGGIVAVCTPRTRKSLELTDIIPDGVYYILDGIEDPYNFGNALRSIYAAGASGIVLSERNWLGAAGTVARASAGASELLGAYICDTESAVSMFRSKGYKIICAGIRDSESIFETDLSAPILVILGGEKRGISRSVLDLADKIVRIDYGTDSFKGSLSASASAAVFAFEILRYNKK